jgi:ribosomal protein L7/L12
MFKIEIDGITISGDASRLEKGYNMAMGLLPQKVQPANDVNTSVIMEFLLQGKIPAIRLHRNLTNSSLCDAKNYVETLCSKITHLTPDNLQRDRENWLKKINDLNDDTHSMAKTIDRQHAQIMAYQNTLEKNDEEMRSMQNQIDHKNESIQELQSEIDRMNDDY